MFQNINLTDFNTTSFIMNFVIELLTFSWNLHFFNYVLFILFLIAFPSMMMKTYSLPTNVCSLYLFYLH